MKMRKLTDLENIRERKSVFFPEESPLDICSALEQLFRTFLIEAYIGHTKHITLTKHTDGSLTVKSYDLGLDLGEVGDGDANWKKIFCKIYADWSGDEGPFEYTREELVNCYLYDYNCLSLNNCAPAHESINIAAVQLASSFMHVEVNRDGNLKKLKFEHGKNVAPLTEEQSVDFRSYTLLSFAFDTELFESIEIPGDYIAQMLARFAYLIPGVCFEFIDETSNNTSIYNFEKQSQYISYLTVGKTCSVYSKESFASASERYNTPKYDSTVRLKVAFAKDAGKVECIHNYKVLEENGTHFDVITKPICKWLNRVFSDILPNDFYKNGLELKWEDISKHIVIILESYCPRYSTKWVSTSRVSINNRVITDMCEDLINDCYQYQGDPFSVFLGENRERIIEIINDILAKRGE